MTETKSEMTIMTTLSFNHAATYFGNVRAPRISFAARLAALQARHEQAMHNAEIVGVIARGALALVPFLGLTWVFVAF